MIKKVGCLFLTVFVFLIFLSGCDDFKSVDRISIVTAITAQKSGDKAVYRFYLLENSEDSGFVGIDADCLENAVNLAKSSFVPRLSLSNLEMYLCGASLGSKTLKKDIEYISENSEISPLLTVALADENTIEYFSSDDEAKDRAEEHIMLLKNNNSLVCTTALSIFNNFNNVKREGFMMGYIILESELSAETVKISTAQ